MENNWDIREMLRNLNGKDAWRTYNTISKQIVFSDGPTGLRYQKTEGEHLGLNNSEKATCFPTASAISCSWNPELVQKVANAIAKEAIHEGVDVVLGPGVNIKRGPLCGRNFEYYSEDPYLSSQFGIAFINGLQEYGIGSSLKHFAMNNQESYRLSINTIIDKRAQEEIYLKCFKDIITEAKPWTIMAAYNMIAGVHCCENKWLLTELLRVHWGYKGLVISDWYAVNDITEAINNGLDLEMPSLGDYSYDKLVASYDKDILKESAVNRAINNLINLSNKCNNNIKDNYRDLDYTEHHQLARDAAKETIVLLKNDNDTLPLNPDDNVICIGSLYESSNYQGYGSSRVNPTSVDSIATYMGNVSYVPGYPHDCKATDCALLDSAIDACKNSDKIIIFAGLNPSGASEGEDRKNLLLPQCQIDLIDNVLKLKKSVTLVLQTGSAVELPWVDKLDAIIQSNLSGQGMGTAIADILLGKVNPSAKLTETYPIKLEHTPNYLYGSTEKAVTYNESIFVGYRYYDKKDLGVLFPFGHGLSYTNFKYANYNITADDNNVFISLDITNTGQYAGADIIQIYVGLNESKAIQPIKQLRAFKKIELDVGETKSCKFTLPIDDFRYYHPDIEEWTYATGANTIYIGKSSRDILYKKDIQITAFDFRYPIIDSNTTIGELMAIEALQEYITNAFKQLKQVMGGDQESLISSEEIAQFINYMPLRALPQLTSGTFNDDELNQLITDMNYLLMSKGLLNN